MRNIDIKTTLCARPICQSHEILVITRGATASINHDLFNKVYTIEYIDQLTFIFKQGKVRWSYEMIEYFKETADTKALADKEYYERVSINIPGKSSYKFILKNVTVGSSVAGLFEKYDLPDGETTDNWQFNDHFSYEQGTNYAYINFMFSSDETLQFKPTEPGDNVLFEVMTRFNTDNLSGMHNKDSVVIDRQHDIAIVDSLYGSSSSNSSGGMVCSDDLVCE